MPQPPSPPEEYSNFTPSTRQLISFYLTSSPDSYGRLHISILSWSRQELEYQHDYIQTLFPLPEPGMAQAPLIDQDMMLAFRGDERLRAALGKSWRKMCWFYGFEVGHDGKILLTDDHSEGFEHWRKSFDHNHLRISRIIRSMRILGLEEEAREFYNALSTHDQEGRVSKRTRAVWKNAMERWLNVKPDVEDGIDGVDGSVGEKWLWEFEVQRRKGAEK